MSITTCPTDIVAASAERIWDLLAQPEKLAVPCEADRRTEPGLGSQ